MNKSVLSMKEPSTKRKRYLYIYIYIYICMYIYMYVYICYSIIYMLPYIHMLLNIRMLQEIARAFLGKRASFCIGLFLEKSRFLHRALL